MCLRKNKLSIVSPFKNSDFPWKNDGFPLQKEGNPCEKRCRNSHFQPCHARSARSAAPALLHCSPRPCPATPHVLSNRLRRWPLRWSDSPLASSMGKSTGNWLVFRHLLGLFITHNGNDSGSIRNFYCIHNLWMRDYLLICSISPKWKKPEGILPWFVDIQLDPNETIVSKRVNSERSIKVLLIEIP